MNGGGKAEKENTPSEANLQEEEVRRGTGWGARGARAGGVVVPRDAASGGLPAESTRVRVPPRIA